MRGVLLIYLIALAVIVLAVAGLIRVGLQKGLGWPTTVTVGLLSLSLITGLDSRVRLALALVGSAAALFVLLGPSRPDSPFRRGKNLTSTMMLALVALASVAVFAYAFTSHMFNDTRPFVRETVVLPPGGGDAAVFNVTAVADGLSDSTKIHEVVARHPAVMSRDPSDDMDCRGCDAHYRLVLFADDAGSPRSVELEARLRVPRINQGSRSATVVEFKVEPVDVQPVQLGFEEHFAATLPPERPLTLLRATMSIPAEAMTVDGLASWPVHWTGEAVARLSEEQSPTSLFPGLAQGPHRCAANEACRWVAISSVIGTGESAGAAGVDATASGSVYYLEAPFPPAESVISFTIEEASAWTVERTSGTVEAPGADHEGYLKLLVPVSAVADDFGMLARVQLHSPGFESLPVETTTGQCYDDLCSAKIYLGSHLSGPIEWEAELHFGFFGETVPAGFVVGDITSELDRRQLDDW